jgi:DNA-binding response OmpR family regulator
VVRLARSNASDGVPGETHPPWIRVAPSRHTSVRSPVSPSSEFVRAGQVELNTLTFVAFVAGEPVHLTKAEFDLLEYLVRHQERVVPPTELAREIFANTSSTSAHVVRVHVSNLRRVLGSAAPMLATVRGRGYRIVP